MVQNELVGSEIEVTIDAVAREAQAHNGSWSRGVKIKDGWLNVIGVMKGDVDELFIPEKLAKGNVVKIKIEGNTIKDFIELVSKSQEHDDDIVNLETLLTEAHKKGLMGIQTLLISHDTEKKSAVFKAIVRMRDPKNKDMFKMFEAHGDADQYNVGDFIKPHFLRMSETRAICRALRWAVNNAKATDEEKS